MSRNILRFRWFIVCWIVFQCLIDLNSAFQFKTGISLELLFLRPQRALQTILPWQMKAFSKTNNPLETFTYIHRKCFHHFLLSDKYQENDLIAVRRSIQKITNFPSLDVDNISHNCTKVELPRLCVVTPDKGALPLCLRLDDVPTDLFVDPREFSDDFWTQHVTDENVVAIEIGVDGSDGSVLGEGFYGQRPVPSLGGGPGYGALADEVWSVSEEFLEMIRQNNLIELPTLDVGIAHGEKARGGSIA